MAWYKFVRGRQILLLPFCGSCLPGEPRAWLVDYGTQRQVPRFSLRNSVSHVVRAGASLASRAVYLLGFGLSP